MSASAIVTGIPPDFDLDVELKAFDETKAGVKGLFDSNISTIPRIFIDPLEDCPLLSNSGQAKDVAVVPVIDFSDVDSRRREEIVAQVLDALEKWGVFQVVNHGIPVTTLEEMMRGALKFHESPTEEKRQFYTRDLKKKVGFASTFDLYIRKRANWRDTFRCHMAPDPPSPHEFPSALREIVPEYSRCAAELGETIAKILAEAVGLPRNYFIDMEWLKTQSIGMHYYPACPQPELTQGATKHTDPYFLTILLQDHIGGLQVLHGGNWVDVIPIHGALIVNIGDFLQLMTNDRFLSVHHRVLASHAGPRVSVPCFFMAGTEPVRKYGPIKEFSSEGNPPRYREVTIAEYYMNHTAKGLVGTSNLDDFKVEGL